MAGYTESDIERILEPEGMIRSRRKIEAVIHNARCFLKVREEFGNHIQYRDGGPDCHGDVGSDPGHFADILAAASSNAKALVGKNAMSGFLFCGGSLMPSIRQIAGYGRISGYVALVRHFSENVILL